MIENEERSRGEGKSEAMGEERRNKKGVEGQERMRRKRRERDQKCEIARQRAQICLTERRLKESKSKSSTPDEKILLRCGSTDRERVS